MLKHVGGGCLMCEVDSVQLLKLMMMMMMLELMSCALEPLATS